MMTFTNTHEDLKGKQLTTVQYTLYEDADLHTVMQEFRRFLLAVSFHPNSVDKYIEAE
jgi:hypothetical protein